MLIKCRMCGKEVKQRVYNRKSCSSSCTHKWHYYNNDGLGYLREYRKKNKEKCRLWNRNQARKDKEKRRLYNIRYRQENKEYLYKKKREWYDKNRSNPEFKKRNNERFYARLKANPLLRIKHNLRGDYGKRVRKIVRGEKLTKRRVNMFGCSLIELKEHLESRFKKGMDWDNYGVHWQIDHIIPLSIAKTKQELYDLNVYTNLQPLTIKENKMKSNKTTKNVRIVVPKNVSKNAEKKVKSVKSGRKVLA